MNASRNWLRSALLGSAAVGLMMTGAQADELTSLKGQLEALQGRVNELEAQKANTPQLPAGMSMITLRRGQLDGWDDKFYTRTGDAAPADRGFTIGVTPTADMPAPVMEVTVSGYVKGDAFYDTHNDMGDSYTPLAPAADTLEDDPRFTMHARQTRFRIKSRSDTSIGQIRTYIEGDFDVIGGGNQLVSNSNPLRARHLMGEWDMNDSTTLLIGQFWTNYAHRVWNPTTVDFGGPAGVPFVRQAQVRITHKSGPITIAVAAENPETGARTTFAAGGAAGALTRTDPGGALSSLTVDRAPDLTGHLGWAGPNGIEVSLDGNLRFLGVNTSNGNVADDDEVGFGIGLGIMAPLGERLTAYGQFHYYDGSGRYIISGGGTDGKINVAGGLSGIRAWTAMGGLSLKVSDTSSVNGVFGFHDYEAASLTGLPAGTLADEAYSVHLNYIWQPVSKLRMGVEGIWGHTEEIGGAPDTENIRIQFGAWFFF